MDINKLKALIIQHGETQLDLADAMGIALSNLNAKLNDKADFRKSEIMFIAERYKLSPMQIAEIFFNKAVS